MAHQCGGQLIEPTRSQRGCSREVLEMDPPACGWVWFCFSAEMFHPFVVGAGQEANFEHLHLMQQFGVF